MDTKHEEILQEFAVKFYHNHEERGLTYLRNEVVEWLRTILPTLKADWLRSEIEKMEMVVEALTEKYYGIGYTTDTCIECSNHDRIKKALEALTTIITRHKEELLELENKQNATR